MKLSSREIATVLAALHVYTETGMEKPINQPDGINDIATNCGEFECMDSAEISVLSQKINCGGD